MIMIYIGDQKFEKSSVSKNDLELAMQQNPGACVRVEIELDNANVLLSTPRCQKGAGGGWNPNEKEEAILEAWVKNGMNNPQTGIKNLIDFLNDLSRF